jgi:hypothetical protein
MAQAVNGKRKAAQKAKGPFWRRAENGYIASGKWKALNGQNGKRQTANGKR